MPTPIREFTIDSFLLTVLIITLLYTAFYFLARMGTKKQRQREDEFNYPSAKKRIYHKDVEDFLSLDEMEQKIS